MRKFWPILLLAAISAAPVRGETQIELAQRCAEAIASGDANTARALAVTITEWPSFVGSELRVMAVKCVVESLGDGWTYSFAKQRMISAEEAANLEADRLKSNEGAEEEREQTLNAQLVAKRREEEEAAKKRLLAIEVEAAVFQACSEIYASEPNTALTNEICLQRFKIFGLPDR